MTEELFQGILIFNKDYIVAEEGFEKGKIYHVDRIFRKIDPDIKDFDIKNYKFIKVRIRRKNEKYPYEGQAYINSITFNIEKGDELLDLHNFFKAYKLVLHND